VFITGTGTAIQQTRAEGKKREKLNKLKNQKSHLHIN
jgi:hypothetical protein